MKYSFASLGLQLFSVGFGLLLFGCSTPSGSGNSANFNQTDNQTVAPSQPITVKSAPTPSQSTPVTAQLPDSASLIIPGERVGSVTRATTFANLASQFGNDRLTNQPFSVGEGETRPATRVNLGETRSFTVIWTDESRSQVEAVSQLGSDWKTPEGIGMGMSLAELQTQLGNFQIYGFAWDYSGTVVLDGTPLAKYNNLLVLRLSPQPGAAESQPTDFEAVMGDRLYDSTNPHLQALYPTVDRIIVRLTHDQATHQK